jgi:hypothetical protein
MRRNEIEDQRLDEVLQRIRSVHAAFGPFQSSVLAMCEAARRLASDQHPIPSQSNAQREGHPPVTDDAAPGVPKQS